MSGPRLFTVEEATHQAYDIFLELAPNNLSDKDVEEFNLHREELGFIEEDEPDEQWQDFVALEIEPEHFIQVLVGLEFDSEDVLFAKILISRDKDAPFCHILWKESE
ncbi:MULTISPECIES: HI1450 family dsDNA-mimic protein [unclassified Pseudoalteromonas]|uniref:HI1450 family dsDNA-mimic protein n=1 Tax=unclassified Pseudoalteromonas TaxID=194690 RepID=UPI0009770FA3|nr:MULTISPECIES: HI1450 family dsDNA-mimic protein [unclassified Pseudoalteromonas]MDN3487597.1 HI1450 family dsDNA-mimic protein [Pseudoalteromonas sp. APC 3694]